MELNFSELISLGIPLQLPLSKSLDSSVPHAPVRPQVLSVKEKKLAIRNALRYFPERWHAELAEEFLNKSIEINPQNGFANYFLALHFKKKGDDLKFRHYLQEAKKYGITNDIIKNFK